MNATGSPDQDALTVASADTRLKRLCWRCRRGTSELDAMLGGWLNAHSRSQNDAQWAAFDTLLDQPDPQLWDWLTGCGEPPRADCGAIVDEIRRNPDRVDQACHRQWAA